MHAALIRPNRLYQLLNNKGIYHISGAIIDIDNTLTNDAKRAKYRENKNWSTYQKLCLTDTININIVNSIINCDYDFIWLNSGREFDYLLPTLEKMPLQFKNIVIGASMRTNGDIRSNLIIKENGIAALKSLINQYVNETIGHKILLDIWDDNEAVLDSLFREIIDGTFKETTIELNYKYLVVNNHDFLVYHN